MLPSPAPPSAPAADLWHSKLNEDGGALLPRLLIPDESPESVSGSGSAYAARVRSWDAMLDVCL